MRRLFGCAVQRIHAGAEESFADLPLLDERDDLPVQPGDECRWGFRRCKKNVYRYKVAKEAGITCKPQAARTAQATSCPRGRVRGGDCTREHIFRVTEATPRRYGQTASVERTAGTGQSAELGDGPASQFFHHAIGNLRSVTGRWKLRVDRRRTGLRAFVILIAGTAAAANSADDTPGLGDGHCADGRQDLASEGGRHCRPERRALRSLLAQVLRRLPKVSGRHGLLA